MTGKAISVWDNYWKRGELHSCIAASDDKNQQEIDDFWRGIYGNFQDDTVILDIGTGNGLLPCLAVRHANDHDYVWEIHGVDLADINPARDVPDYRKILEQINFQARIAAEELPFDNEYCDLITSQYAIEYSDMARSVAEVSRVLKQGGVFCALLHSRHSLVVGQNNDNAREVGYLLDSDIFSRCKTLLSDILFAKDPQPGAIDRYVENLRQLSQRYNGQLNIIPTMQNSLMEILNLGGKYHPAQIVEMVDNARRRLKDMRDILLNLVNSALGETELDIFVAQLEKQGLEITRREDFSIGKNNAILGYYIQAQK